MLEFDRAQALLIESASPPSSDGAEHCPIGQAAGRVLAHDYVAAIDMPPADNSAMDGYAIRLSDYAADRLLPIQQRCYAGDMPQPLLPGKAIRLFTGSLVPEGADAIVMQENCTETAEGVAILTTPVPDRHIRRRGEDVARGTPLIAAGTWLGPAEVALLAAQGQADASVWPRPRIGVLTTGDEIVQPGTSRSIQQIYNSNGFMLPALIEQMGAVVSRVEHAIDDVNDLRAAFQRLNECSDLILSVGGVSVGERDLVKPVLESMGGELVLWKVRMKPGKPVALGNAGGVSVVCLPGNPVSAYAVFTLLVTPMIRRMQGRAPLPPVYNAVLRSSVEHHDDREEFLRVQMRVTAEGQLEVSPHAKQSSGVMSALPWASGLARIPAGATRGDGSVVRYYDFQRWLR